MINNKNFDNIRLFAVLSILALHTNLPNIELVRLSFNDANFNTALDIRQLLANALYNNIFKAGTILFFIISGFLFEMQTKKTIDITFISFLKKKTKSLLLPYFVIFFLPMLFIEVFVEPNFGVKEILSFKLLITKILIEIFLNNYWFVPALFITLMINHFIKTKQLFKSLLFFTPIWILAYLNIFFKFTLSSHTVWFVGFFVIFTIGRIFFLYKERIAELSVFKNTNNILALTFVAYAISNIESMIIIRYGHNTDYLNTLRIGNIVYSILIFFLLNSFLNKKRIVLPFELSFYFIYLVHPFVLKVTNYLLTSNDIRNSAFPDQFLFNLLHFTIMLLFCFVIHNIFFKLGYKNRKLSEYVFNKKIDSSLPFISWVLPKLRTK